MRRPLLYGTVFFVLPIIISELSGISAAWLLSTTMLVCLRLAWKNDLTRRILSVAVVFCLFGSLNVTVHSLIKDPLLQQTGETVTLQGVVQTVQCKERSDDKVQVTIMLRINGGHSRILLRAFDEEQIPRPGDRLVFSGTIEIPQGQENPNCFDYRKYLASHRIHTICNVSNLEITEEGGGLTRKLYDLKLQYLEDLEQRTDHDTAALLGGILFGDKSRIDEDILTEFQKNGTAHILAVSGLHVGILYAFLAKLWPGRKRKLYFCFILSVLWCYCILASMSASVVRASLMISLHTFGKLTDRRYDLSSAAFLVILLLLVREPLTLYDTGFQMSFLAVLSISLMMPYVRRFHDGVFSGSIAVQAGLLPYTMYTFNYLPLGAFLVNVPIIGLVSILVPAGLFSMSCCMLHIGQIPVETMVLMPCCKVLTQFNDLTCVDGCTTFLCKSPPRIVMAVFYTGFLVFLSESGRLIRQRHTQRVLFFAVILVLGISVLFGVLTRSGFENDDLIFVSVGQGDCLHLRIDDKKKLIREDDVYHVLIDGGGRDNYDVGNKILRPYLLKNGVDQIDLAIVTHLHTDHYDGIRSLCCMGMVKKLCVYEGYQVKEEEILAECKLKKDDLIYVGAGDMLTLGDATFTMLAPPKLEEREYIKLAENEEDENKKSLLMKAEYHGVTTMMTGDIGEDGEEAAIRDQGADRMDCDILKVGHHGSKTSSCDAFLDAVSPLLAVIQVGRNNMYGHPTPEVLQRLDSRKIPVCRTDLEGAVGIRISRGQIRNVHTMIEP